MKVALWGTRGSIASAGPETVSYGGNTSCVEVKASDGTTLILDAGTGIRRVGATFDTPCRLDVLLTHLHMDHIQGLGFFGPLFRPGYEIHLWGPPSTTQDLRHRLGRYLSPPLFPVRLRDVDAHMVLHDVPATPFTIGPFTIQAGAVIHPGPTIGYRIADGQGIVTYIPDHEPALGLGSFPVDPEWTSGVQLARDADVLVHDTQYTVGEYQERVGWGHSRIGDAVALGRMAGAHRLVTFHHDPGHDDAFLDGMVDEGRTLAHGALEVLPGREGMVLEV